ncbi:aldehyde dehydrogenase (NADP(+)) [Sphingomonas sp. AP4-R1]|uniref:aldehyde dehydrogenase (NADP(+)) n=1 Tax=Sphingomonas sp. AP4-R1 TaxID=2735134 RepID=UPI001493B6AB|nr:aldehyde dehydrogenase (NADP(+)) [Sphingomonas sp. AP4-R1]QJU59827.1 aldehyde dehydrogenase (NADP(+)) [Sphingomonas sp. AP4-R1]
MTIQGSMFIGAREVAGGNGSVFAIDPATGETLQPAFGGATSADLDRACALAAEAAEPYAALAPAERAEFLEAIADGIMALGDELIVRVMAESGLPRGRLEGERGRTCNQLKLFASVLRAGRYLDVRIDPALPDRTPPRPDLRVMNVPLGPVAVFGASNFPLAFSVAGGDTASSLAAGCPVVAKAHPAHPGTSELVGRAVRDAVAKCGLPEGVFSLIMDSGYAIGSALVADPRIKAVGFTGSRRGGLALQAVSQARAEPIPVYAEMSSINPVVLFPHALAEKAEATAKAFVASLTLGSGQFCTNPGLVLAVEGEGLDRFIAAASEALTALPAQTMLTPGIAKAYREGVSALAGHADVETVARGAEGGAHCGQAGLFVTTAEAFLQEKELQDEIFGAASLVVRCLDMKMLAKVVDALEGQLTAAIHIVPADEAAAADLLPRLRAKVGRLLVNNFGTGVEVAHAMVHGGPYPATSDARSTSVGSLAIARFLRPFCFQDLPDTLLPDALKDANPLAIPRLVDGTLQG